MKNLTKGIEIEVYIPVSEAEIEYIKASGRINQVKNK